jgi:hypothetical protein
MRPQVLELFSLLLGIPEEERSGVFIAENAHRCRSPTLHLQGKCSMGEILVFSGGRCKWA